MLCKNIGIIGPLKKAEPFLLYIVLDACCHKCKLTFLESVWKEDSFDIHHDHIQFLKNLGFYSTVGLGLKFEVVFRIGLWGNFHNF
jgi:hypothetical protein